MSEATSPVQVMGRKPKIEAESSSRRGKQRALVAIVVACVLWGVSLPLGKVALRELPVAHMVLGRFVLALLLLLPLALSRRVPLKQKDAPLFLISGVLMVPVTFLLEFEGLARTSVTSAALIIGAIPPLLALAAYFTEGERMSWKGWGAVLGSALGVALMVGAPGVERSFTGDLLVFASAVTTAAWVLVMRRLLQRYPPLVATVYTMTIGTLTLVPFAWWMGGPPRLALEPVTWCALVALGIGCTAVTYSLWNWGLRHIEASHAGVFVNLEPLVGAALGIAFFGDPLGAGMLAGGALVLSAAFVITTESRATPSSANAHDDRPAGSQSDMEYASLSSMDRSNGRPPSFATFPFKQKKPMIARTWHGAVAAENADIYHDYLLKTGIPDYKKTPGNRGVYVLRRTEGDVTHFLLLTLWESLESVRAFAGDDVERARYYPKDEVYLLELEPEVTHYEVPVHP